MIYLDYNATCPPTYEHLQELFKILIQKRPANPSSPHALGQYASVCLAQARKSLACALHVDASEIIFTSGGTEANNLGTRAVVEGLLNTKTTMSIITTSFEHHSVLKPLEQLKERFKDQIELIVIKPNSDGYISIFDVISNIKSNTALISIMAANNEIGTIQPVKQFADFLNFKRWQETESSTSNKKNLQNEDLSKFLNSNISQKNLQDLHFHVDAVQMFGKIPTEEWMSQGYDSIAVSGHKLGALQGVGALVLRRGRSFLPLNVGGAQEKNRRAGTENIPAIISFGMICEKISQTSYWSKISEIKTLTHDLFDALSKKYNFEFNSKKDNALPNTIHFSVVDANNNAENIILKLDMQGVCVSSGSACSSSVNLPSHVVLALGKSKQMASNSVRISLGVETTHNDIQTFLEIFENAINKY